MIRNIVFTFHLKRDCDSMTLLPVTLTANDRLIVREISDRLRGTRQLGNSAKRNARFCLPVLMSNQEQSLKLLQERNGKRRQGGCLDHDESAYSGSSALLPRDQLTVLSESPLSDCHHRLLLLLKTCFRSSDGQNGIIEQNR
jgi:hypothetical protein